MKCMGGMEMIFLIFVFLVGGLWEAEALSVTGELGGKVTIKCSHTNAISNIKYFCRGECKYEDVLISSREDNKSNFKYSIKDEGNTFYVTISQLTQDDSSTYWCGVERVGLDTYNEVVLTVTEANIKNSDVTSPKRLVYIGAGVGMVVFCLMMTVLIFQRCGRRHTHSSSGKDHDSELSRQKNAHHITTSSTASEDEEADDRTNSINQHQDTSRYHTDNIYSNVTVSSEVQIQPEALCYTTVSFNKHAECSTAIPLTAAVIYCTVTHKSVDESKL